MNHLLYTYPDDEVTIVCRGRTDDDELAGVINRIWLRQATETAKEDPVTNAYIRVFTRLTMLGTRQLSEIVREVAVETGQPITTGTFRVWLPEYMSESFIEYKNTRERKFGK